eukprot:50240-Pelagomonas_calceolata.AAC.6
MDGVFHGTQHNCEHSINQLDVPETGSQAEAADAPCPTTLRKPIQGGVKAASSEVSSASSPSPSKSAQTCSAAKGQKQEQSVKNLGLAKSDAQANSTRSMPK